MSFNKIDSIPLVSSKLITDIIFSVYKTPSTLGLYILIICTSPLYIWIVITAISKLIAYHNYKAGSYIVEFNIPAYLGLYPSFLVTFPFLGLRA